MQVITDPPPMAPWQLSGSGALVLEAAVVQPSQQVLLHSHSLFFSLEGRCGEGVEVLMLPIKLCLVGHF